MIKSQNKDKIYKKATKHLKNSHFLKSIILSMLILSNAKLTPDLIAEDFSSSSIKNTKETNSIEIECNEETKFLAKNLKTIINDLQDDNNLCKTIVSSLENNNIIIKITEPDKYCNGYYIIGKDTIYIPQNNIPSKINNENKFEIDNLKKTIIHETIHMLQDKNGIFKDCENLTPMDNCIINALVEIDAICKSYIIQDPQNYTSSDEMFFIMSNIISCLDTEIKIALNKSKKQTPILPTKQINTVINKLNFNGIENYKDINTIINTIKENITPNLMQEIQEYNNNYIKIAQLNSKKINTKEQE